jgi:hypothetical protein
MIRGLMIAVTIALFIAPTAGAQTTTSTGTNGDTAIQAVGGTPGSWVRGALTRHSQLIGERVTGPRSGKMPTLPTDNSSSSNSGTSTNSLSSLLSSLGSGGLGDLTSLLGSLTGGNASTGTTGTTGTSGSSPSTSGTSSLADLIASMALAQGANPTSSGTSKLLDAAQSTSPTTNATTGTLSATEVRKNFGGAIARLPKPEQRFQSTAPATTTERSFGVRFLDATLQTVFTALTVGFQSSDFITFLEDQLRPLILPSTTDNSGSGSSNSDGSGSSNSGGSGSNNSSGSGIEDLPSGNGSNGSGGSTI